MTKKYPLLTSCAKYIGRTLFKDDTLWCALSGSGVSFTFTGLKLDVEIFGDDRASSAKEAVQIEKARIAFYIDGERVLEDMVTCPQKIYSLIDSKYMVTHQVQIIKLSEAPMSVIGISRLLTDESAKILPLSGKRRKLEFIGDSITCGYGVDDSDLTHSFSTATEDVTKGYAYLTAQALNADYSMISYSGYGIYSGYTERERNLAELVPPYYTKVGFSRGTINGYRIAQEDWDFRTYKPDMIIVNLGTNDFSYCQNHEKRLEEFIVLYQKFLQTIRKKNKNSYILCTYGMMNQELMPSIKKAIDSYKEANQDAKVSFFLLPLQSEADGYVINYHPSIITHIKSAEILTDKIRAIMNWA